jgi:hypothetical protein
MNKIQHDKYKKYREGGFNSMSSVNYAKNRGGRVFQPIPEPIAR